jgi:HEAT repeat protein
MKKNFKYKFCFYKNLLIFLIGAILTNFPILAKEKTQKFPKESEIIKKINSHLLLEDNATALIDAQSAFKKYPNSQNIHKSYIKALSKNLFEFDAIYELENYLNKYNVTDIEGENSLLLEDLCFDILLKAKNSSQYVIKFGSLVGSFLTKQAKAVDVIVSMMEDSNAIIRAIAVQLSSYYRDDILKDKVSVMLDKERVWLVKVELIKAVGNLKLKDKKDKLKEIINSKSSTFEEKTLSIQALVNIYDNISINELKILKNSKSAAQRILACELAVYFEVDGSKDLIKELIYDSRYDVKIAAINSIHKYFYKFLSEKEMEEVIKNTISDNFPSVAITSAYLGMFYGKDKKKYIKVLEKYLNDDDQKIKIFTASAISSLNEKNFKYFEKHLDSKDKYVAVNVAYGLIGKQIQSKKCCDIIYDFLLTEKKQLMLDNYYNKSFETLRESIINHVDHIPNYPTIVDQITRLRLLSILTIMDDKRAFDAIKTFLKNKHFELTATAAATLLQEGDEKCIVLIKPLLKDKDQNIVLQAAIVLAILGKDESALSVLEKVYLNVDRQTKLRILESIGSIGKKSSIPFLLKTLKEPFQILRIATASAIIQCINN